MPLDDTSYQRITRTVTDYNAKIKAIRDDDNLSAIGKQRALAALYVTTRDEVADLRKRANDAYQERRGYLMGEVFGVHGTTDPAAVMAMRDAMTRVADLDSPTEARKLFQQAHLTGDEYLRRAVAAHAHGHQGDSDLGDHWGQIFTDYAATQDERRQNLLGELDTLNRADSKRARFQEQLLCGISRPSELDGHGNIDAIVSGVTSLGQEGEAA